MTTPEATTPVFDGLSITELSERVAKSIRAINHLSMHPESTPDPAVIYRVVMDLHTAATRLSGRTSEARSSAPRCTRSTRRSRAARSPRSSRAS